MSSPRESALSLVSAYYEAFNSGHREAFLSLLTEEVKHDTNQGGRETGKDAFRVFLERMDRCYAEQVKELQVFASDDGTRAAAEFFIDGTYKATDDGLPEATGQRYYLRVGAFFELVDGKVDRITNYYNLQEWLRLVGA